MESQLYILPVLRAGISNWRKNIGFDFQKSRAMDKKNEEGFGGPA